MTSTKIVKLTGKLPKAAIGKVVEKCNITNAARVSVEDLEFDDFLNMVRYLSSRLCAYNVVHEKIHANRPLWFEELQAVSRSPWHMASWPVTFFIQSNSLRLLYHALRLVEKSYRPRSHVPRAS